MVSKVLLAVARSLERLNARGLMRRCKRPLVGLCRGRQASPRKHLLRTLSPLRSSSQRTWMVSEDFYSFYLPAYGRNLHHHHAVADDKMKTLLATILSQSSHPTGQPQDHAVTQACLRAAKSRRNPPYRATRLNAGIEVDHLLLRCLAHVKNVELIA